MCRLLYIVCLVISTVFLPLRSFAQAVQTVSDSTSTAPIQASDSEVEIIYSADSITYDTNDSTLVLIGNAEVKYGDITLKAGQIRFNTRSEILFAESIRDSAGQKRAGQLPTLVDPQGTLVGERMEYDIKTQRGRILGGKTKYEQGFFEGKRIRVDEVNTLRIDDGSYSSCDNPEHKHYLLRSNKTKILPDDKALVKDVVAYVYGVPVFYFPFYILPLKRGRHSGVTIPTYGTTQGQGTYLRNIGYYWAASEYWDLKVTGDVQTSRGYLLRPELRYAKNRRLRGRIRGSYQSEFGLNTTGWDVEANHWQELRPDLRVTGQAQFANSLSFIRSTTRGTDPGRLQPSLRSNLTVDKLWGQKSMTFNVSENSTTGTPVRPTTSLSFRLPTRPIFAREQRRSENGFPTNRSSTPGPPTWYQSILFSYNGRIQDQRQDSTATRQTVTNNLSLSSQQNLGGWLKLQPNTSYSEVWTRETDEGLDRQNTYSAGLRANTTLYGLFPTNIGPLESVRHVMTPSVSFSQSGPRNVSRTVNFDLRNVLQAKTVHDDREKKFDVLLANFSTGYNFNATTRNLADLSSSLRAPSPIVNFDAQFNHRFYEPTTDAFRFPWLTRTSINTSINLRGSGTSTTVPGGTTDSGLTDGIPDASALNRDISPGRSFSAYGDDRFDEDFDRVKGPWAVTLTHRYAVSRTGPAEPFSTSSHLIRVSNRFNLERVTDFMRISNRLTRKWRMEHSINYDIRNRRIDSQTFNLNRNLHCWEFSVRYTPNGFNKGVYFRLNIIAHPEIKLEQQRLLE